MKRLLDGLKFIIEKLCIFMIGSLTILVILSVILRYVFNIAFIWAEEFITMLFVATTYYGIIIGTIEDQHITIDFLNKMGPKWFKKSLYIISSLIIIAVQIVMLKYSISWIEKVGYQKTPGMQLPYKYFYIMIPISCSFIILYQFVKMITEIFNKNENEVKA